MMSMSTTDTSRERVVDHGALRTNQAFIIALLALGFVLDAPALVALVSLVMLLGTAFPQAALFKRIYQHVLQPAGIVKADVIPDNPEPHQFAQGVGGLVSGAGAVLLFLGASTVGWLLAWVVIILAGLNLFAGWCAGCTMYYWFNRLGVPGFDHQRVEVRR